MALKSEIYGEGSSIVHRTSQPTEDLILDRNAELRKNPGAIKDLGGKGDQSWGRQIASIPFITYNKAIKDGFQLNHSDVQIAEKELFRFLKTPEGQACLVR